MLPPPEALSPCLPTERIGASGKATVPLRDDLRHFSDLASARTVAGLWLAIIVLWGAAAWWGNPIGFIALFLVMGPIFARMAILGHEAAHRLLFHSRPLNDFVGRWLLDYPAFVPFDVYRRSHFAHHKEEFGPTEPDLALYNGYPITRASWRRKLTRDAVGISGWKNLKPLFLALKGKASRPFAARILGTQLALWAIIWAATGRWWLYPVCWLGPWMTVWRVLNRLRAIAEHGGMQASPDRRLTTHHVHQSLAARLTVTPYNTGWHLAHHMDMGVPWRNLPRYHQELVDAGWVVPALEHDSYRAFWRLCSSRPEVEAAAPAAV